MKDAPLTACPTKGCRGKVKRLIGTGAGLIFKGSGFYITDYRSEGYKQARQERLWRWGILQTNIRRGKKSKPAESPKSASKSSKK